jgi:hypothetical protein
VGWHLDSSEGYQEAAQVNLPAVIDALIEHSEEVDPRDYNAIRLRRRVWLRAIEIVQEVWDSWDWDFRYKVGESLTLTAGQNSVTAPSDFHSIAYEGSLWVPSRNWNIREVPANVLMEYRRMNSSAVGIPQYFAVFGGTDAGLPVIQFDRNADTTYTLALDYEKRPPRLLDRPDAVTAVASDDASTLPEGVYRLKLVYVSPDGNGPPSDATSVTVTGDNVQIITVTMSEPPTFSNATSKTLFMTEADGTTYYEHTDDIEVDDTSIVISAPVSIASDEITAGFSGIDRLPEGLFGVILAGLKEELGYDEGDSRSGGEAEGRFRKRLARFKREYPSFERKLRQGDLGLTTFRMH